MSSPANVDISTPAKRLKLTPRRNPYWTGLAGARGGVSLGYRRVESGDGAWIAKVVVDGTRVEQKIGTADDGAGRPGALTYRGASAAVLEWSRQKWAAIEASAEAGRAKVRTVGSAVEHYIAVRRKRSSRNGADAERRLRLHVLSDEKFSSTPLSRLRSTDIHDWRDRLPVASNETASVDEASAVAGGKRMTASTLNRLLNDVRAALNAAAERHRRELPGSLPLEIKIGTRAVPASSNARRQFLSEEQIAATIAAAFEVDEDFGFLVLLAAATGARHSQLRRILVGDVQIEHSRVMVPPAGKGRSAATKPPIAVPLSEGVMKRLAPILDGRAPDEPLLMRWHHVQVSAVKWTRERRRPWGDAVEIARPWAATVERAELPKGTVFYAWRHTSIIRGLRAGLPVRLVAASHDTSTAMLEKHYARYILDAAEELSRRAAFTLA